ncbi:hypothetical protein DLM75_11255 [Leptospira stimsonii]|uniref:Uncharacterized protein n=1 Tax=Leptospira stimsonii TaxID=2202203 RepID=A0A396Z262_9LEPT|nr:hypothetical protein DLM75_11255 [Leptospira stimsonii]
MVFHKSDSVNGKRLFRFKEHSFQFEFQKLRFLEIFLRFLHLRVVKRIIFRNPICLFLVHETLCSIAIGSKLDGTASSQLL